MSPLDIAHRGASADRPENTLEAFELAIEQGADMIETDLHRTRDGRVVLVHDSDLHGAEIATLSFEEVRRAAPSIPTLEETLDACRERIPLNLELKRGEAGLYDGIEEVELDEVSGRGLLDRTLFSSFHDPALERVRALEPDARIGLLVSPRAPIAIEERARRLGAEAVHPGLRMANAALIDRLHDGGFRVYVFTVDRREDQTRLLDLGVDGLFTNYPSRLRALLDGRRAG